MLYKKCFLSEVLKSTFSRIYVVKRKKVKALEILQDWLVKNKISRQLICKSLDNHVTKVQKIDARDNLCNYAKYNYFYKLILLTLSCEVLLRLGPIY